MAKLLGEDMSLHTLACMLCDQIADRLTPVDHLPHMFSAETKIPNGSGSHVYVVVAISPEPVFLRAIPERGGCG